MQYKILHCNITKYYNIKFTLPHKYLWKIYTKEASHHQTTAQKISSVTIKITKVDIKK